MASHHRRPGCSRESQRALPHVHLGLPVYAVGHSLVAFALVNGFIALLTHRRAEGLFGWLLHILIDIPTHSFNYYATRFLWPISDFRVDGIAWWTPWFWVSTYAALDVIYVGLWRKRSLREAAEVHSRQVADCGNPPPGTRRVAG